MSDPAPLADELRAAAFARAGDSPAQLPGDTRADVVVDQAAVRAEVWHRTVGARFADARLGQLDGPLAELAARWDGASNVLLLGDVGVGKTHAAAAMAYVEHVVNGRSLLFRSAPLLLDEMRPSRETADRARQRVIDVDLLVIDDLGSEKPSDWTAEQLGIVVDERYRNCRPTIVTSNRAPQHLQQVLGERVWSRLYQDAVRHTIGGNDRRKTT